MCVFSGRLGAAAGVETDRALSSVREKCWCTPGILVLEEAVPLGVKTLRTSLSKHEPY